MSTTQIIEQKRRCSKKLFTDLPQRVIVHKILISHELYINLKEEKNPFLLFGYFLNDRLRNIWFIFSSIFLNGERCGNNIKGKLLINYYKLCNVHFYEVSVPNIVNFSHRMYNLRSLCVSSITPEEYEEGSFLVCRIPEGFFSESKFPKLRKFSLISDDFSILKDWHECEFFDQLKSLSLNMLGESVNTHHFISFFRAKEKIFVKNMKKLSLTSIELNEKVIISLPNLEILILLFCKNLFVIPSEKKLKAVDLFLDPSKEIHQIALNSRNARFIEIKICSRFFLPLFEEEDFPNLKKLITPLYEHMIEKKWKFSSHLKELKISSIDSDSYFFQKNEWDELETLKIEHTHIPIHIKDVKFPNLRILTIYDCPKIDDDFFEHFEGKKLEVLDLHQLHKLTGRGWNKNIFRNLKNLGFNNEFDDSFFQENEFPNLKKMILWRNETLKDRDSWREMKSLEEIQVDECKFIKEWKRE